MNNMQFDEATQTYRGTVEPYHLSDDSLAFIGTNKPLQVSPEWMASSHLDMFASFASGWQSQGISESGWWTFSVKPWAYLERQDPDPLIEATDGALQQLIQAMAGFAPMGTGQVQESMAGLFSAMQILGVQS